MMESTFTATPFDWLSDLQPAFAAQESWRTGRYLEEHVFHYSYLPDGPFAIACGAGLLAEHVRRFRFSTGFIQHLGQVMDAQGRNVFQESFLNHLQRMRLRVQVNIAPEGTLMLPGEPLLVAQGPLDQIQLLESAFRLLLWQSTHWATLAAHTRWKNGQFNEEDTPLPPNFPFNPDGWKIRAAYIGGALADEILASLDQPARDLGPGEGLLRKDHQAAEPLVQIRRLYRGNLPLGDLWLSQAQEEAASVSKTNTQYLDERTGQLQSVQMSRFQNLYQPALVKGHPALATPRLGYLRQRMLKQLQAFQQADLGSYGWGWFK
ncbi:MAG: hypothetical protein ABIQ93_06420 [Saprospiraceae bacterium]